MGIPMKLKFKVQAYQTAAVDAVVECFAGQPRSDGITYRMDPGCVFHAMAGIDSTRSRAVVPRDSGQV